MEYNKILSISKNAFFIGFMGDLLLQIIVHIKGDFAGLNNYFEIHGKLESLFIASGMMFLFIYIYLICGYPFDIPSLFIYGGILDLLFRYGKLFPSLSNYYKAMSVPNSFVWGGIPLVLVYCMSFY